MNDDDAVIVVDVPATLWKTSNGPHEHWRAVAGRRSRLKRIGWATALSWRNERTAAGLPVRFDQCELTIAVQYPPHAGRADPANTADIAKPLVDGFTRAGLWADDDSRHITTITFARSATTAPPGLHRLEFHIHPADTKDEP